MWVAVRDDSCEWYCCGLCCGNMIAARQRVQIEHKLHRWHRERDPHVPVDASVAAHRDVGESCACCGRGLLVAEKCAARTDPAHPVECGTNDVASHAVTRSLAAMRNFKRVQGHMSLDSNRYDVSDAGSSDKYVPMAAEAAAMRAPAAPVPRTQDMERDVEMKAAAPG